MNREGKREKKLLIRMAKIKKKILQCQLLAKMQSRRISPSLLVGTLALGNSLAVSWQVNIVLPNDPQLYSMYLINRFENLFSYKNLQSLFAESLFIIARKWKQLICPPIGEWKNNLRYGHLMTFYSVNKGMRYQSTLIFMNLNPCEKKHV